ncbi:MAG: DUF3015 domain-containing protein [Desulfobacteraceae bacterium]|nr:DUF3015 domain-containing protein [Desulfobacteraceae bacterium]
MKKILIAATLVLISVTAYANTVSEDCGCGLGHVLIGDKEGLVWGLLGTCLNGTSGNQTFGMTTGTLGCDTGGKIVMNEKIDIFVADNMDNLAMDIAAGEGETLEALAEIALVSDKTAFFVTLQNNFDTIYPSDNVSYNHVSATIRAML